MFPTVLIVAVYRIGQKDPIQYVEAADIASPNTKEYKILTLFPRVQNLDLFPLHLKIHQILCLREKEILRTPNRVQRL